MFVSLCVFTLMSVYKSIHDYRSITKKKTQVINICSFGESDVSGGGEDLSKKGKKSKIKMSKLLILKIFTS